LFSSSFLAFAFWPIPSYLGLAVAEEAEAVVLAVVAEGRLPLHNPPHHVVDAESGKS
jgi:hypothetical protein